VSPVPVVLRHHEALELNLVEYCGAISLAELKALAEFQAVNTQHLRRDCLAHVRPGAHFACVDFTALDDLFAHYRALFAPLDLQIVRRSAWLCESEAACRHVRHWLAGDPRTGMASAARQFDTFAEACEWLLLSDAEAEIVARAEGFAEIAAFDERTLPRAR
jgi:hypothetical protein